MRRPILVSVLAVIMVLTMSVGMAFAGEVTGNGKSLKNEDGHLNGRSICAFSGLNDTWSGDPNEPDEDGFTRTQNWGQLPKEVKDFLKSVGSHPGQSCNPNSGEPAH